ncbi:MAG TPA: NUDIX domain-containing protein [Thermomicrobiales bacterium]|nr:NUDIX domain-containing protein [Thermomicrobiales bacterium]
MNGGSPDSRATTDPQDELFDLLDAEGRPTGVVKARGDVHRDGDWHAALHIWVGGVDDDGEPFALFQRRSLTKDTWAGYLDTTVGGHLRSGETLEETVREANEEIGLEVGLVDLTFVGRHFIAASDGTVAERELHLVHAVRCDQPLADYRLHPEEVASLVSIPIDEVIALCIGERNQISGMECTRDGDMSTVILSAADFVGGLALDSPYPRLALTALSELLAGRQPESFELRSTHLDD